VNFNNPRAGSAAQKKSQFLSKEVPRTTPILRSEITYSVSAKSKSLTVTRLKFPLKLCWACTIHKIQVLKVDKYHHGQAYVALSSFYKVF